MLLIEMLPAGHGDALVVEYGTRAEHPPSPRRRRHDQHLGGRAQRPAKCQTGRTRRSWSPTSTRTTSAVPSRCSPTATFATGSATCGSTATCTASAAATCSVRSTASGSLARSREGGLAWNAPFPRRVSAGGRRPRRRAVRRARCPFELPGRRPDPPPLADGPEAPGHGQRVGEGGRRRQPRARRGTDRPARKLPRKTKVGARGARRARPRRRWSASPPASERDRLRGQRLQHRLHPRARRQAGASRRRRPSRRARRQPPAVRRRHRRGARPDRPLQAARTTAAGLT